MGYIIHILLRTTKYTVVNSVVFDLPLTMTEHCDHRLIQSFKNNCVFRLQYETTPRVLMYHIVVFCKFSTDLTKLSEDRWKVSDI